ncbi:PBP1A family penicillin-binding protein [Candidatus Daviesbacteria bacterium]|nr:PBP1A family penicillin-binding protein [Candidatus Daviesbacteria bacterium]
MTKNKQSFSANKHVLLPILLSLWILNNLGKKTSLLFKTFLKILISIFLFLHKLVFNSLKTGIKINLPAFKFFKFKQKKKKVKKRSPLGVLFKKSSKVFKKFIPSPIRIAIVLTVILLGFFFYSFFLIEIASELPSPAKIKDLNQPVTTEVYDRNNILLYRFYEGKNRSLVKLEDLPSHLVQATISIEDKNFYAHSGVDFFGISRAIMAYIKDKEIQGGSTITQQLIKNTLLTPDRTVKRKLKEIILSFWAERIFTKDQILQMYFNEIPYGGTSVGIAAAAQTYFGKNAGDLNLAESAYLAGLPASPTNLSPYGTNPQAGKKRQWQVLERMVEDGYISKKEADEAYKQELVINSPNQPILAPHFVMYIRDFLTQRYGAKMVSQGGLKVITTLDLKTQEMAEQVVKEEVERLANLNVTNGAAMVTDAKTGQILAMVGSKDYFDPKDGNFNVALALRQPGSSIKPATYATAFKQGYSPGNTLLDTPVVFKNDWEVYTPVNYDGKFHGPVSIRTALGSSYNVPAVKMLAIIGIPNMIKTAQDLGITTFTHTDRYGLSLTLGAGEVKLIDMMTMYGTFSQLGVRFDAQPILKITDSKGVILEDNSNIAGKRVLPQGIAYMITNILTDNKARTPAFGPNSLLNIPGHTVAVKTGTSNEKKDNWTFGFTPEIVVGVWVGNNDNSPMNPQLSSGITGASPIWNRIMTNLLQGRDNLAFQKPDDVTEAMVDGKKDLVISGNPSKSIVGFARKKDKESDSKESITFTDPFSTFTTDQPPPVIPPNP